MSVKVYVPRDSAALSVGAEGVARAIASEASSRGLDITLVRNGSRGMFWLEPLVEVETAHGRVAYGPVSREAVTGLFDAGFFLDKPEGKTHALCLGPTEELPYLKQQERLTFARCGLISGEPSPLVDRYAEKMSIPFVLKGTRDKAAALREFTTKFEIPLEQACFFGDDINDLSAMEIAGLCACPCNAAAEVLAHVAEHGYTSPLPGGQGAVRSFADAILAARKLRGRDVFQLRPPE
jgi:3-deoxy-D-manno-octulosonate 8-phosphate phosphatase KdsC-like HAD superfamily phosphatase